jgi:scyllo-inositol 2-dehydrogenase (NADP+)
VIRAGVIGRGIAGSLFHAPFIRAVEGMELVAVAGRDGAGALIADRSIDLVVIATPNITHFPLAEAALEAGKHVVVDKPFALSLAEADALIALAAAKRLALSVFHNRRWDGDFLTVQELIGSGRLGEVLLFEAYWDRFRPVIKQGWREEPGPGAGLLWDLGPHLIDQALLLFGLPEAVSADVAVQREGARADDYFLLTLHYGRMRALLGASSMAADPRKRFGISGTEGGHSKRGLDTQEAALRAGLGPESEGFGAEDVQSRGTIVTASGERLPLPGHSGRWLTFYERMRDAIRGLSPVPVDPADARAGLLILETARQSSPSQTGRGTARSRVEG